MAALGAAPALDDACLTQSLRMFSRKFRGMSCARESASAFTGAPA